MPVLTQHVQCAMRASGLASYSGGHCQLRAEYITVTGVYLVKSLSLTNKYIVAKYFLVPRVVSVKKHLVIFLQKDQVPLLEVS